MTYHFAGESFGRNSVRRFASFHRKKRRGHWGRRRNVPTPSLEQVADPEFLLAVYDRLRREGGQAPGPDGLTYDALSRSQVALTLRTLGRALRDGTYRPGPARAVRLPKPGGGHRTLTVRGIFDRVVAKTLSVSLTPTWEKLFSPWSMGFRPGVGARDVLAAVENVVLATDDVRKAFDNVVIADVVKDHHTYLQDPALLALTEVVLRGSDGAAKEVGIDQGSPYSPAALNLRLHHLHDVPFTEGPTSPPWYRYADNLVYLCQSVSEGHQTLEKGRQNLEAGGLTLKGADGGPVDLRGGQAQLPGFTLTRQGD
jgi:hypothetical protein